MTDEERSNQEYEDDGHATANMNVEGMPWYRKEEKWHIKNQNSQYTAEEMRYIILGTIKAALMIAGTFLGSFFLLILLICIVSWLRY